MLYLSTIDSHTLELLRSLQQLPELTDTRLVGGTSLALQIGHRRSIDIDLFGRVCADSQSLSASLSIVGDTVSRYSTSNIHAYTLDHVMVDIVNYSYPWLNPPIIEEGIRLASVEDIAAMKVTAIVGRGTRKDFVDMAFLLDRMSLSDILHCYLQKFADGSLFMALKSLLYFDDAEQMPMPQMLIPRSWDEVKEAITRAVIQYQ